MVRAPVGIAARVVRTVRAALGAVPLRHLAVVLAPAQERVEHLAAVPLEVEARSVAPVVQGVAARQHPQDLEVIPLAEVELPPPVAAPAASWS